MKFYNHYLVKIVFVFISFFFLVSLSTPVPNRTIDMKNWHSHAEIARKVVSTFKSFKTYQATFTIKTYKNSKRSNPEQVMQGKIYYQNPSKLRYEFTRPRGDLIVSNGSQMWFYIEKLKIVGKQSLSLKTKLSSNTQVFKNNPATGIEWLFNKYHYKFAGLEQPRPIDKSSGAEKYFILDLEQREKIGGYEKMTIYIEPKKYLVRRAEGHMENDLQSVLTFDNIVVNANLPGSLFQYTVEEGVKVVNNPLVQ